MKPAPEEPDYAANPHDAFFKEIFSQPELAIGFFREHLPAEIVAKIDWQTLQVMPGSFVKTELQQVHSDLLFSVKIDGRETLLYLLFEHQTAVDPLMPLRLLAYLIEIFLRHHATHGLPLPPVLPFVFHQGPTEWKQSQEFKDLFNLPEEFAAELLPFLPNFRHLLLDLSQYDPASRESDDTLRVILQLMKMSRDQKVLGFFRWLADTLAGTFPDSLLGRLLYYALHSDGQLDVEDIYHNLASNPELRNRTMTIADKLIAKGHSTGRVEGREEGELIGRIHSLEDFLTLPVTPREQLLELPVDELKSMLRQLNGEYKRRFKRS